LWVFSEDLTGEILEREIPDGTFSEDPVYYKKCLWGDRFCINGKGNF
jgi:hypothetical protein